MINIRCFPVDFRHPNEFNAASEHASVPPAKWALLERMLAEGASTAAARADAAAMDAAVTALEVEIADIEATAATPVDDLFPGIALSTAGRSTGYAFGFMTHS